MPSAANACAVRSTAVFVDCRRKLPEISSIRHGVVTSDRTRTNRLSFHRVYTKLVRRSVREEIVMAEFPPLTHVALTVRDLSVSVPWYEALFDADPVIDEDTEPNFHHTAYLLGN